MDAIDLCLSNGSVKTESCATSPTILDRFSVRTRAPRLPDNSGNNRYVINLAAMAENILTIQKRLPQKTNCMVIVKAMAYGSDEIRMAKFLETCNINTLGVAFVDEGIILKQAGATQSIFVINATPDEAVKIVQWELEIGVSDGALIEAIAKEASLQNKTIKVHLHIDTGMNRLGCRPQEALSLAREISAHPSLILQGVMSHLACSEDPEQDDFTHSQVRLFDEVIAELKSHGINPLWKHVANSSGTIRFNFTQYNMVRIGLAVYGLHSSQATKDAMQLQNALSLLTRIVGINNCRLGETVSYGRNFTVTRDSKIAVLPIGYFDGFHRNYSGKSVVMIHGQKAPMVGRICMDFMMVDVTDIPLAAMGDSVLVFGKDEFGYYLSPEELANSGDTIIHELITCLGPRIQRIFVHEETCRSH